MKYEKLKHSRFIVNLFVKTFKNYPKFLSITRRANHYFSYKISKNFELLLKQNAFYEHAEIFGNYYGTSKSSINQITKKKNNVLFDIDWQGSEQLSKFKQLNLVKVFILPPNKEELESIKQFCH